MLTAMNDKVRSIDRHMQALEEQELSIPVAVGALSSDIDGMIAALNSMKAEIDKILSSPICTVEPASQGGATSAPIHQ